MSEPNRIDPLELQAMLQNSRGAALFYDSETRPAEKEVLEAFFDESKIPYPKPPGEFDPSSIRYGNMRDQAKKDMKLRQKRDEHYRAVGDHRKACQDLKQRYWEDHVAKSTLDPCTGRILAIGYLISSREHGEHVCLDIEPVREQDLLLRFWDYANIVKTRAGKIFSFNGHNFDLPFITRRSWAYEDVKPLQIRTRFNKYEDFSVDAYAEYKLGQYGANGSISLNNLAKMMGVRTKLEGMTGDQFHSVYISEPDKAKKYLELDVMVLKDVATRMNLV